MHFLIHTTIIDGEHEHRHFSTLEADNQADAEAKAEAMNTKNDCDLDAEDNAFAYGDEQTETRIENITELTPADYETLLKLRIA